MKPPCIACHFCVVAGTSANATKGSNCIWYGTYINAADVAQEHPLREMCRNNKDGDNFVMRMPEITPLDYFKHKHEIEATPAKRWHVIVSVGISIVSAAIALAALYFKA